ncbi:hypothetical protein SNEBB_011024 [Seison nebaliae]|nr:hypothetical protein SNEBB_011024 [Seison nebaliae]
MTATFYPQHRCYDNNTNLAGIMIRILLISILFKSIFTIDNFFCLNKTIIIFVNHSPYIVNRTNDEICLSYQSSAEPIVALTREESGKLIVSHTNSFTQKSLESVNRNQYSIINNSTLMSQSWKFEENVELLKKSDCNSLKEELSTIQFHQNDTTSSIIDFILLENKSIQLNSFQFHVQYQRVGDIRLRDNYRISKIFSYYQCKSTNEFLSTKIYWNLLTSS